MTMENDLVERLSPERIFATVNGASTRLPDGARQLIGGWSMDASRPRVIEYVRADITEARIQALEAELARKTEVLGKAFRAITYPADTSIEPTGYGLRHDPDSVAYAAELLIAALVLEEKTDV